MTTYPEIPSDARTDHAPASVLPDRLIAGIVVGTMAMVLGLVMLFDITGRDWWVLLRDPATAFGFAPYAGLFSHLGVLALAVGGAISVFAALLLRPDQQSRTVLLSAGTLSIWLALDDLFMLHESVLPRLLGLPETAILGLYLALAMGLVWLIGRTVLTRHYLGFWTAAVFLSVMLVTDLIFEVATSASFLVEESAKICGFMIWAAFWIAEAKATLQCQFGPQEQGG